MVFPAENARRTFADVLAWDENERAEIIDGQVFMMAPPSRVHQEISGEPVSYTHLHTDIRPGSPQTDSAFCVIGVDLCEKRLIQLVTNQPA